jgi:predicted dehydrogenase
MKARIGIVGAGFWAVDFYLPFLERHPKATCVGVVRPGETALKALRKRFGLEVATESFDRLLDAGCDGIVVASPHSLHSEHAIHALRRGKHVLVEKPMAVTMEQARAMQSAVRETGMSLTVAHGFNYLRMSTWAIDLVRAGSIGRPLFVTGHMASALAPVLAGESGYGRVEIEGVTFEAESGTWAEAGKGGGYLFGQLSHLLGLALAFVESQPGEVFARARRLPNGVDIDVSVSVSFDDATIGSFTGTGRMPWGMRYPLDLRVVAEEGVLNLDFDRERADAFIGPSGMPADFEWGDEKAFVGRAPDFAFPARAGDGLYTCAGPVEFLIERCLGNDPRNRAPVELGVRVSAILEAAARSALSAQPVSAASPIEEVDT